MSTVNFLSFHKGHNVSTCDILADHRGPSLSHTTHPCIYPAFTFISVLLDLPKYQIES